MQPEFAVAVARLCRAAGIHVAVETCGCTSWRTLRRLAATTDLFLYDLKDADAERHRSNTGADLAPILSNLRRLVDTGADVTVRVPVIPGCNGTPDDVRAIARAAMDCGVARISLLPFNPASGGKYAWLRLPYPLAEARRQTDAEMSEMEEAARSVGLEVVSP
jgi:pyruvate formate lyase activating enzyme